MPYFKNDNINLLFIHIPKTGGSSLEEYFSYKYNIPLNNKSLFWFLPTENKENNNITIDSSLQHLSYETIMKYKEYFQIDASNIEIISIVRNPYNRIISDLFFFKKINIDSSKEDVYNELVTYFTEYNDNHVTPQYLFITDENKQLIKDIKLLKTESLTDDMINLGYTDFNIISNANPNKLEYDDYLNDESINLINNFYEEDFKIFGYDKRIVDLLKINDKTKSLHYPKMKPIGKLVDEIPAGMMDANLCFGGVAMKEIYEETGLVAPGIDQLVPLGSPVIPSAGGCDEEIQLFFWETKVDAELLEEMKRKIYGEPNENETIQLIFVLVEEYEAKLLTMGDVKAICAHQFAQQMGLLDDICVKLGKCHWW